MESADERALRRELQELTKKREALDTSKRRGSGAAASGVTGRRSVFARLGGEVNRTGGGRPQLKENGARGNAVRRLGKRDSNRFDADSDQNGAPKRQKLHSAVARPEGSRYNDGRAERRRASPSPPPDVASSDNARAQQRKQRAVAPYAQKEGIARSRRMFGALMGHLGKAKRQIEKDTDLFKRQDSKQHEAEQREKMQAQDLETRARRKAEVTRVEALIARTQLDRSEQVARAKLEHLQMVRKSEHQSKFLVTVASPPIYYLPARHTKDTEDLLAASMEAHEAKLKASARTHEEKLRKLEAEFAAKLEQLRGELEDAKTTGKEKLAHDDPKSSEKDDSMDGDEDMDKPRKESEEEHKGTAQTETNVSDEDMNTSNMSPKGSASEDEDIVQERVSGSDTGGSPVAKTITNNDDPNSDGDGVRSNARCGEIEERYLALSGDDGGEKESSPGDANVASSGDKKSDKEAKEDLNSPKENSQRVEAAIKKDEEAQREDQSRDCVKGENSRGANLAAAVATPVEANKPKVSTVHVDGMKVTELRKELKMRGLDTKGLKAKLVQRLKAAIEEDESQ